MGCPPIAKAVRLSTLPLFHSSVILSLIAVLFLLSPIITTTEAAVITPLSSSSSSSSLPLPSALTADEQPKQSNNLTLTSHPDAAAAAAANDNSHGNDNEKDKDSDNHHNNNSDLCLLSADKFTASCNDLKRAGIAMNRDGLTADDCAQVQAYNGCRKELLARENAIRQCRPFIAAKIRQMDENIDKFCAPVLLAASASADANSAISSRLVLGKGNYAVLLIGSLLSAWLLNIGGGGGVSLRN